MKFPATHILAFEADGKMVETLVLLDGEALLREDEWAAHSVPDWTIESDGRLYYCGIDYAAECGKCTLRAVGSRGIPLDTLLMIVRQGRHSVLDIARALQCSIEEVSTGVATLQRLGQLERASDDRVLPVFEGASREDRS
jgi:hypothetical protein